MPVCGGVRQVFNSILRVSKKGKKPHLGWSMEVNNIFSHNDLISTHIHWTSELCKVNWYRLLWDVSCSAGNVCASKAKWHGLMAEYRFVFFFFFFFLDVLWFYPRFTLANFMMWERKVFHLNQFFHSLINDFHWSSVVHCGENFFATLERQKVPIMGWCLFVLQ